MIFMLANFEILEVKIVLRSADAANTILTVKLKKAKTVHLIEEHFW